MYNDLFSVGSFTVHGYGLMIAVGVLAAVLLATYRAKKRGMSDDIVYGIGVTVLLAGFLGAKLLYCLLDIGTFLKNPLSMLSGSGFVVYGGIVAGALAAIIYCRVKKVRFLPYLDLVAPSVAIAQGFGRIGCFLAGCCYGRETTAWFGVVFPENSIAPGGIPLIPTQLFSSAGDFVIASLLLFYAQKKRPDGKVGGLYLILYSVGRFLIEFLRNDYRGSIGVLSTSQFIAILTLALGAILFLRSKLPVWGKYREQQAKEEE